MGMGGEVSHPDPSCAPKSWGVEPSTANK